MTCLGKKSIARWILVAPARRVVFLQITSEYHHLQRYKLNVSFKAGFDITRERNTLSVKFIVQLEYIFRLQFNEMLELSRDVRKFGRLEL